MAEDQTSNETQEELKDDSPAEKLKETSKETAEEKETPTEEKTTEPVVDYKVKFRDSQREAIRLAKELETLKAKTTEPEGVEKVETETEGETLDQIVDKKVQERLTPLQKEQQEDRVNKWLDDNPKALDHLKEIEDAYPTMPGKTVEQKLENAYLIATKEAAKQAGKKEMAFSIYQREQAVVSGGGASSAGAESSLPPLSDAEKQVARSFGLSEEAYAKRKSESTKQ